jgi:hypothetical protein
MYRNLFHGALPIGTTEVANGPVEITELHLCNPDDDTDSEVTISIGPTLAGAALVGTVTIGFGNVITVGIEQSPLKIKSGHKLFVTVADQAIYCIAGGYALGCLGAVPGANLLTLKRAAGPVDLSGVRVTAAIIGATNGNIINFKISMIDLETIDLKTSALIANGTSSPWNASLTDGVIYVEKHQKLRFQAASGDMDLIVFGSRL